MVEIKLESLVLADSPKYLEFDVINIPYVFQPPNNITTMYHFSNALFFDNLQDQYGILYKYLYGYNDSGQYTQAYITGWNDEFITTFTWSNQRPAIGSTIKLTLLRSIPYLSTGATESLEVGENLIEGTLSIKQQFESLKEMDLRVSTSTFDIIESNAINTFMGKYWTSERYPREGGYFHAIGVHIKLDGVGKFWGYIKPENIIYDPEMGIYTIDAFDWIKFILDTKGQNYLPDYPSPNLSEFLTENMVIFNELVIEVGDINQNWDQTDYNYILEQNSDGNDVLVSIEHLMTVEDMIIECMKHYGAYMYYDGDKNLVFRNRSVYNTPDNNNITEDVVSQSLTKVYSLRDYDSLIINVEGTWLGINGASGEYNGWALIWWENNELQSITVNANLDNVPTERKPLDLRQSIPYEDFRYRLFASRERSAVYNDYIYLLFNSFKYNADIMRTDLSLGDLVVYNGNEYIIRNLELMPDEYKSILLMERKIGD